MGREVFTCSLDPTTNSESHIYDFLHFFVQELMKLFWQKQQINIKIHSDLSKTPRDLHSEFGNRFSKHLIHYTDTENVGSLFWPIHVKLNWKVLRELPFMKNNCSTSKRSFHAHRHLTLWPVYLYLYLKSWRNFRNM